MTESLSTKEWTQLHLGMRGNSNRVLLAAFSEFRPTAITVYAKQSADWCGEGTCDFEDTEIKVEVMDRLTGRFEEVWDGSLAEFLQRVARGGAADDE